MSSPPGLPDAITACLFDLDGVLTRTAEVHAKAWKQTFDEFLRARAERLGEEFKEFRLPEDYEQYVDGKPRIDGVKSFLESREIELPEHTEGGGEESLTSIGDRKNELLEQLIDSEGVSAYEGSVTYVKRARELGVPCAVVSSSSNTKRVLKVVGIEDLFDGIVDGVVADQQGLAGKPAPDTFLAGARLLGVEPSAAAVFEDALAGVEAGRAGHFGCVVGVNRNGEDHAKGLREHGADIVVDDLEALPDGR